MVWFVVLGFFKWGDESGLSCKQLRNNWEIVLPFSSGRK